MRSAALCMGYGGLELALDLAGVDTELAWCAEKDPHASKVIAERWPDVPNLGDLTAITDPTPVDLIAAGFPCQDISTAGQRAGLEGARSGLWWTIAEIVGDLRPRFVVLENVAAIASLGGPAVVGTLAGMGYSVRWGTVRASDIGAPHRRERWFCVARHADSAREDALSPRRGPRHPTGESGGDAPDSDIEGPQGQEPAQRRLVPAGGGGALADAADDGLERTRDARRRGHGPANDRPSIADTDVIGRDGWTQGDEPRMGRRDGVSAVGGESLSEPQGVAGPTADTDREPARRDTRGASCEEAGREDATHRPDRDRPADGPPAPADADSVGLEQFGDGGVRQDGDASRRGDVDRCARAETWGRFWPAINRWERTIGRAAPAPLDDRGRLNPVLVEFMMGLPEGWVTDVDLTRSQMLHILGNGVVPQQAARALRCLS